MDRAERRRVQKELTRIWPSVSKQGIPIPPEPHTVGALSLAIRDEIKLARSKKKNALGADVALKSFELTLENNHPTFELACKEGCSFCCYVFASLTAPEVFLIADYVRANFTQSQIDEIIKKAKKLVGLDVDSRFGAKIPCPLLRDNRCSVYTVRPIACRQCATNSSRECEAAFHGNDQDVGYSAPHTLSGIGVKIALQAAIKAFGQDNHSYELGEALLIALKNPESKEKWLSGVDVFVNCQKDNSRALEMEDSIDYIADSIK